MDWSEELQAAHRSLSAADLAFRERARQDPELLSRATFALFDEEKYVKLMIRIQSWPTFVGREKREELRRASLGLSRLIRAIPERIFGNDPGRIAEFYDLDLAYVELLLAPPNGIAGALSRGDFVDTAEGLKCLEFNFFANLGGWEVPIIAGLQRQVPATVRYLGEAGLSFSYTDPVKVMLGHVVDEVELRRLGREGCLNLAFVGHDRTAPWVEQLLTAELGAVLRRRGSPLGGKVFIREPGELSVDAAGLRLDGARIHAVVEFKVGGAGDGAVRCYKASQVVLLNGPIASVLGGKDNLGLLSEHQDSALFTAEEREVLARHLPWTRIVSSGRVRYRGEEAFLPDLLAARREDLVLKASSSYGGKGVAIGRSTPEAAWGEAVRRALGGERWIVQERVDSRPFLFQVGDYGCAPHAVIWGPFVFGDKYGGAFLRVQPTSVEGPVSVSGSDTGSAGLILEV